MQWLLASPATGDFVGGIDSGDQAGLQLRLRVMDVRHLRLQRTVVFHAAVSPFKTFAPG